MNKRKKERKETQTLHNSDILFIISSFRVLPVHSQIIPTNRQKGGGVFRKSCRTVAYSSVSSISMLVSVAADSAGFESLLG